MDVRKIAREIVEGSVVLLKNEEELLPFAPGTKAAFFGRAQLETILSGNGSGAAKAGHTANILEECERREICPVPALKAYYEEQVGKSAQEKQGDFDFSQLKEAVNSGLMYEIFGKYNPPAAEFSVPEELIRQSAGETDTAVLVIGRQSGGEECDRHLEDDYYLTPSEKALAAQVCGAFPRVAVILNINGLIDLSWLEEYPGIQSAVFLGVPGEEGPAALANILCGAVSPSGKLPVTIARHYEEYPAALDFSWDKEHPEKILTYEEYGLDTAANGSKGFAKSPVTVYREDIYLGYRYFDTFGKKPLFPFGFGLSYTRFSAADVEVKKTENGLSVTAVVKNEGSRSGKEVLQLYSSAFGTETKHPYQELKGIAKTRELACGESETLSLTLPWEELACYQEKTASWSIESGGYLLRLGNSSAHTEIVACVRVGEDISVFQTENCLGIRDCNRGRIEFLAPPEASAVPELPQAVPVLELTASEVRPQTPAAPMPLEADWESFSPEELAALCVGYGPGTPFAALRETPDPNTIFNQQGEPVTSNSHPAGFNGYVSPAIEKKGIYSIFYKDGPAGVGETAWPSEMLLASSFDLELCARFGDAVGAECEKNRVDVWLAPAVNLHRHPLGGRNFEYLSEDPYLTGACACAIARGVQKNHPVLVCAKHFAVNEQETYRRGSARHHYDAVDSILTERAARELYLKPFEMLVKRAGLRCMMTSFNKLNGVFAGGSKELCTRILRQEWGFDGLVVTDWGDMDIVVDGADAVAAGNDVVMPGGPPVIVQIVKGYEEGRVTREELQQAVSHLLSLLKRFGRYGAQRL